MTPVSYIPCSSVFESGEPVVANVSGDTPRERGIAQQFVTARRHARFLAGFPGSLPTDLDAAYRCQDEAIALWPDQVAGWKVGWVPEPFGSRFGEERLVGPIFKRAIQALPGNEIVDVEVFAGGFAAIEGEFIFQLGADAPADKLGWSPEEAATLASSLHVGIEIASSPLATINELGAAAIVSDFGNNAGLVVGAAVPDWRTRAVDSLRCECRIDGAVVGRGGAASLPGGPLAALAFALQRNARRGRALRAGDFITTGASTGVHDIRVGQYGEAHFQGIGTIRCRAVAAQASRASLAGVVTS
jgi:2-keto-4-pentenoate hydratase